MPIRIAVVCFALFVIVEGRTFLQNYQDVDSAYVNFAFGTVDRGIAVDIQTIKDRLVPLFDALPKNQAGQLAPPLMQYAVRRYFSQRYGWTIKGFEPETQGNSSTVNAIRLTRRKFSGYIEGELGKMLSRRGFGLQDMVVIIASIETLIYDENLNSVQTVYGINGISINEKVSNEKSIEELLSSYFLVELMAGSGLNMSTHMEDRESLEEWYPHWPETKMFMQDIVQDVRFQLKPASNPFSEQQSYDFQDIARVTRSIDERFGPFANHECHDMKLKLAEMDTYGTGRVKLADFYRAGVGDHWQFSESSETLRIIGALDESSAYLGPQVIIPNYITGQHNCMSSSEHYEICCLNECDGIFQHFENHIKAPTASAAEITRALEVGITFSPLLSSSAPTEARNMSAVLRTRLEEISSHHQGAIPLHGRLFAQWLHYAFPQECPYPHMSGTVSRTVMSSSRDVTEDEVKQNIESEAGRRAPSPKAGQAMWNPQEELLAPVHSSFEAAWDSMRLPMLLIMLAAFSATLAKEVLRASVITDQSRKDPMSSGYDI